MNDNTWERVADAIDVKFGITKHGKSKQPVPDKPELEQEVSFICFTKDGDDYKLERIAGPAIIDRKSIHGRSATSGVRFENVYDPTDISYKTNLYRQTGEDWEPVETGEMGL